MGARSLAHLYRRRLARRSFLGADIGDIDAGDLIAQPFVARDGQTSVRSLIETLDADRPTDVFRGENFLA